MPPSACSSSSYNMKTPPEKGGVFWRSRFKSLQLENAIPPERVWLFGGDGGFDYIMEHPASSRRMPSVHRTDGFFSVQIPPIRKNHTPEGYGFLAEMEGFEPPHALRRLADFESAPFSHLGTSPLGDIIAVYAQKIKAFSPVPAPVPSACRFPHNSLVCEGEGSAGNP